MNRKAKLLTASNILLYISSLIYAVIAAFYFALSENIYWLYFILCLASLIIGLLQEGIKDRIDDPKKSDNKLHLALTISSIISPVSFALNIIERHTTENIETLVVPLVHPIEEKPAKKWYKKPSFFVTIIGFALALGGAFTSQLVETSLYSVEVKDFTLTREMTEKYNAAPLNGKSFIIEGENASYGVTQYIPKSATADNPAPTIFVMPGFTRTKTTMAQYCIEMSRRGCIVFCIDPGCQGSTTAGGYLTDEDGNEEMISSTVGANGVEYLVQYVYNNKDDYPMVDRDKFGAIGHSAGGGNVAQLAEAFAGNSYEESVIKSLYISGYIKTSAANRFKNLNCNTALVYAYYDEGAFRYQTGTTSMEVIGLRFINEVRGDPHDYTSYILDYEYGNIEEGTMRVIHREMINHCFQMYDPISIENSTNFFRKTLNVQTEIADRSQVWAIKEVATGISLVGGFMFTIGLAGVLLALPFMRSLRRVETVSNAEKAVAMDLPRKKKSNYDRICFWLVSVFSSVLACLDFIPLAYLSINIFPDAASNTYTFFFPARMFNAVMLWALVNGAVGLVLFFGILIVENIVKKIRHQQTDWSKLEALKINWKDLIKTFLFSIVLFLAFYGLVYLCYYGFHSDFRFMLISASVINYRFFVTWLMYIPAFFVFYISNSIKVNCSIGREGWSETRVYITSAIMNSIGLVFILLINYFCYFETGIPFYGYYGNTDTEVWLYINMVFPLVVMMFLLPIFNRIFYKYTGKVYLGALVNCMIFIMMSMTATVSYIPL